MTTFWQVLVSFKAHLAHMPSPEIVTFFSSSDLSALSTVSPENIKPATASTNNFRIVGLPQRYQIRIDRLGTQAQRDNRAYRTVIEPPPGVDHTHFFGNGDIRRPAINIGGESEKRAAFSFSSS